MKTKRLVGYGLLVTLLWATASCNRAKHDKEESTPIKETETVSENKTSVSEVSVPAFKIRLKLTRKAEKKISSTGEDIVVKAFFTGLPKNNAEVNNNMAEEIILLEHAMTVSSEAVVSFDGLKIPRSKFNLLRDKNYNVLINIYSGRKTNEDNILDGEVLQGKINDLRGKEHDLKVDLLGS